MKSTIILGKMAALITLTVCLATSCKKDASSGSTSTATTVTEQDAADAVTNAIAPTSAGVTAQVSDATVMAASAAYPCGQSFDSSIIRSSASGAAISWSYTLGWGWKLTCGSPANFAASFNGHSMYDALRMSSSDSSKGSFTVTGLSPADADYTFNTSYERNGSQQSKIGNKNAFTSKITVTSTNIKVDKATREIISGAADVTISGASSSGKSFSFSGTLTFNGGKTAVLQIAGGTSYTITW